MRHSNSNDAAQSLRPSQARGLTGSAWRTGLACLAFALALLVAPLVFTSGLALTMLSQMGYVIVICLSYNLLLGQGGMLSFGHAVYSGLGAFVAIHAINRAAAGDLPVPLVLIPLVGGLGGMLFALLLGYVSTKKSGTTFAMITLGMGELVAAVALMFPGFFGGERGISADRVYGEPWLGLSFGPQIEVYYLIAAYCLVCTGLLFALTRTPLGRMLNAVRDNPERAMFIGYNTRLVRYIAFVIAGFFAGIGGGLAAINFEIVNAESLSMTRSGGYLLFTVLGGTGYFFGPIIGAVLLVASSTLLSELTKAWLLYLGLAFMGMVLVAPGGVASIVAQNARVIAHRKLARLLAPYAALVLSGVVTLAGFALLVEMTYHRQLDTATGPVLHWLGQALDTGTPGPWAMAAALLLVGLCALWPAQRWFARRWAIIQGEIAATHVS